MKGERHHLGIAGALGTVVFITGGTFVDRGYWAIGGESLLQVICGIYILHVIMNR